MAKLKRALGMWETTLCGVGIIFGAGIYALIGEAAGMAGNAVWISFAISAVLAGLTGLSYAELSSRYPKAGAEYVFSFRAFGRRIGFMTGWMIFISGAFSATAVSIGFSKYFNALFGFVSAQSAAFPYAIIFISFVLITTLSGILLYGVKQSAWLGILFTIVESAGLVLIILIGIPYFGSVNYFEMAAGLGGIFSAAALIFFAFIGFEDITRMSEETKNPTRNIPRALVIAIVVSTVVYVLVAVSAVSILGWQALGDSHAPMADVASKVFGPGAGSALAVVALFSTFNTVLLILMATSRILYGMASTGALPRKIAWVHPARRTPWVATILVGVIAVGLLAFKDISLVAGVTDFAVFLTFMIINLSLIKLRYSAAPQKEGFRVPLSIGRLPVLPVAGAAISLLMMYHLGADVIIMGIVTAGLGLVAYLFIREVRFGDERFAPVHAFARTMEHGAQAADRKLHKIGAALRYKKT